jgi:hypothetical protein
LDAILHRLVEKEMRVADIIAEGFDRDTVRRVERLPYLAEYKRRPVRAGREGRPEEFRPRPPLPNRQPFSRSRPAGGGAGRFPCAEGERGDERAVRGVADASPVVAGKLRFDCVAEFPVAGEKGREFLRLSRFLRNLSRKYLKIQ